MLNKIKEYSANPLAWFIMLVCLGVALTASASHKGTLLRVTPGQVSPHDGCIPIMEKAKDNTLTGRITCATEEQVLEFCHAMLQDYQKKGSP